MAETMLSIGLMSGTSMDGIDAALLKTDGEAHIEELGHVAIRYDSRFKLLLHATQYCIKKTKGDMEAAQHLFATSGLRAYLQSELKMLETAIDEKIAELQQYLFDNPEVLELITLEKVIEHSTHLHGLAIAELLKKTGYIANQIDVVGYHGQTMYHQPGEKISIVVGDGQALANQVGITVVNDFRACDVAAGGQGAPFAPIYHQALAIRDHQIPAAVVNCGGIANITFIKSAEPDNLIGFDTGPGNGLIDREVRQRTGGNEHIDQDGKYGLNGVIDQSVLNALYKKAIVKNGENYFDMKPPKALDFGDLKLIDELKELSIEDACATLEAFTADTIVHSIELANIQSPPKTWILAGGGWSNPVILHEFESRLKQKYGMDIQVMTADQAGWNSQAMEAQIFAHFAVRSLQGKPLSVPGTTCVPQPTTGGHAYLPQNNSISDKVAALIADNPAVLQGYDCRLEKQNQASVIV